jgi:DNA-binding transcriptional regulator YhcF (GntR family)
MEYMTIDTHSAVPKYQQIINSILEAIHRGELSTGDRLPSLNGLCKEFALSQDTVLRAYNELKSRQIIASTVGKGYYVDSTDIQSEHKVFLLFDKLTLYKEQLYDAINAKFKNKGRIEIFFHHNNKKVFSNLIREAAGNYSAYVVIPIQDSESEKALEQLPPKSVYILDLMLQNESNKYPYVCQRFEKDVYSNLQKCLPDLKKYRTLYLICPGVKTQHQQIRSGFERFARRYRFRFEVLKNLDEHRIKAGQAFLVVDDLLLVEIIKRSAAETLHIGKEVGIISYNKTPLKEVMANGITTISTDFGEMGSILSDMILQQKRERIYNTSALIKGRSL